MYYRNAAAAIVVYDVTKAVSDERGAEGPERVICNDSQARGRRSRAGPSEECSSLAPEGPHDLSAGAEGPKRSRARIAAGEGVEVQASKHSAML